MSSNWKDNFTPKIGILGLGYVGLPVALAFARSYSGTIGFDVNKQKVEALNRGEDPTDEGLESEIRSGALKATSLIDDLADCNFFVVAVPTPVDANNTPDLTPLRYASEAIGKIIKPGSIVVFESTVYPGVTEDFCGPVIQEVSGLKQGEEFTLGYSPERINPGDKEHTLERIIKVVSGEDPETLAIVSRVYGEIIDAGIHEAPTIKVAEAAKVIENTQRDLNIALMNELSIIFEKAGIRTIDVLKAAGTKWNFLPFRPGLVGGHCIGVDPFYLTMLAERMGYYPEVILAGRRINDQMGRFVAQKLVKLLAKNGASIKGAKVGVLGITFKENVADLRNSKVPSIVHELTDYGLEVLVHDPIASGDDAKREYGVTLSPLESLSDLDACVLAVSHDDYKNRGLELLLSKVKCGGVFIDVKAMYEPEQVREDLTYWAL